MVAGRLFFIVLLLILGAFLVLAEFAIVRVRPTQLESLLEKDSRAHQALEVQRHLQTHLSSILVGVSLCAVGFGALGEDLLSKCLSNWLGFMPGSGFIPWSGISVGLASFIALIIMTTINVVLAELVPRSFAIRNSTLWALRTAKPLLIWSGFSRPLTITLSTLSRWVERLLGLPEGSEYPEDLLPSEDEFKRLLAHSQASGELELNKAELIENVFSFSKRTIMEITIPRGSVVTMDIRKSLKENLALMRTVEHSRIPLIDGDLDHVVGVIHLKDLLWRLRDDEEPDLKSLARPAFFVPEMRRVQDLLLDFQRKKQHMALVVNEHGGVDGIVTFEDVIEELVGEIQDEFDNEVTQLTRIQAGAWLAQGTVTLEQLDDQFGLKLEADTDAVTLGGYFQERLGRVLRADDEITIQEWQVRVLEMSGMAPKKFLFKPIKKNPDDQ
ncbi:MAG: hemolysin family protein [Holophagales bacterium]|jgi:CBS domain containing-hemolysin-like protein|nr:hemolysin family protein [Holophagales bacterium]